MRSDFCACSFVMCLVACGEDPSDVGRDAPSGDSDLPRCLEVAEPLDEALAKLQGVRSLDCGTVTPNGTREAYERTRQCVVDSLRRGDAFHALKWEEGDDSSPATGFASAGGGQPVTLVHYDSDPSGGSGAGASLSKQSCTTLVNNDANPSCADEYRYQLCLLCAEEDTPWEPLCHS